MTSLVKFNEPNGILSRKDPFSEFDKLFDSFFNTSLDYPEKTFNHSMQSWNDGEYHYYQLPVIGVDKDDLDITLKEDKLYIKTEKKKEDDHNKFYQSMNSYITIPRGINKDSIDCELKNGILTIQMKKLEESKTKQIKIK